MVVPDNIFLPLESNPPARTGGMGLSFRVVRGVVHDELFQFWCWADPDRGERAIDKVPVTRAAAGLRLKERGSTGYCGKCLSSRL